MVIGSVFFKVLDWVWIINSENIFGFIPMQTGTSFWLFIGFFYVLKFHMGW